MFKILFRIAFDEIKRNAISYFLSVLTNTVARFSTESRRPQHDERDTSDFSRGFNGQPANDHNPDKHLNSWEL